MNKRTEMQGFRTSKETKEILAKMADHYGLLPGPFVALLVERFIDAHEEHKLLAWPPEFLSFDDIFGEESPGAPHDLRADTFYQITFEDGRTVEDSSPAPTKIPEDFPEEASDDEYWNLIYKDVLARVAWRCEKTFEEKPKAISVKIWNVQQALENPDGSITWCTLTEPLGEVELLKEKGLL